MLRIFYSSKFEREYRRIPERIKEIAEEKEWIFRADPHDPRLHTHQLSGRLKRHHAFSINQKYRIIFEFATRETIWFHSIGDHSIYEQ